MRDTARYTNEFGCVCIKLDNGDVLHTLITSLDCMLAHLMYETKHDSKISKHEEVEFRHSGLLAKTNDSTNSFSLF